MATPTRRSSRIPTLQSKSAIADSTPTISQHFQSSKPTTTSTKRKYGEVNKTNKNNKVFDTQKFNDGASAEAARPAGTRRKRGKIMDIINGTPDGVTYEQVPNLNRELETPNKNKGVTPEEYHVVGELKEGSRKKSKIRADSQAPASNKQKTDKIMGDNFLVDHLPSGAAIAPTPVNETTRRPGLVAANTAPRQVKQLSHTVHPLERLDEIKIPEDRLVDPYQANAPLIQPGTLEVLERTPVPDALPNEEGSIESHEKRGEEILTTENVLEKALEHLKSVEPKLIPIIEKHHCGVFDVNGLKEVIDPWVSLTSSIIGQQVSGAAAKSIKNKFVALFNEDATTDTQMVFPTPSQVAETSLETLRTAGLSQRKAEYIKGLAEKFASGDLTTEFLMKAPYEEVFEKLVAVRGLGAWSVEMFACFGLKRLDVFSTGDLGVQRGMAALMGKDVNKLKTGGKGKWKYMSEKDMLEISEKFRPYRSVFMWYMWRVEDVDVTVMEKA